MSKSQLIKMLLKQEKPNDNKPVPNKVVCNFKNTKGDINEVETLSNCNLEIHEHLSSEMDYVECPFCDQIIGDEKKKMNYVVIIKKS